MKKISKVGAALILAMAAGSVFAAGNGPVDGKFGLNVNLAATGQSDVMVKGRYMIAKDMAVQAGFGLSMRDSGAATSAKNTDVAIMGGFRKYLKTDELSPFVGAGLQYLSTRGQSPAGGGLSDVTRLEIGVEAGAEYFLSRQFSVEGSVGFGYVSTEYNPVGAGASTKATQIGTGTTNLSANFYY